LRVNYKENERQTQTAIAAKRKRENIESSTKQFGNKAIGIHLKELPKFQNSRETQQYWAFRTGYNPNAQIQSQRELVTSAKYWANPDELYLSDFKDAKNCATVTKFHATKPVKGNVTDKITNTEFISNDEGIVRLNHNYGQGSWANQVSSKRLLKSQYDIEQSQRESLKRYVDLPLYSSFTPNKEFPENLSKSSL
jgi:hypothetical protein